MISFLPPAIIVVSCPAVTIFSEHSGNVMNLCSFNVRLSSSHDTNCVSTAGNIQFTSVFDGFRLAVIENGSLLIFHCCNACSLIMKHDSTDDIVVLFALYRGRSRTFNLNRFIILHGYIHIFFSVKSDFFLTRFIFK